MPPDFGKAGDAVDAFIEDLALILLRGVKVSSAHTYLHDRMTKVSSKQLVDVATGLLIQQAIVRAAELEASKLDETS